MPAEPDLLAWLQEKRDNYARAADHWAAEDAGLLALQYRTAAGAYDDMIVRLGGQPAPQCNRDRR